MASGAARQAITLAELISAIQLRQPVLNLDMLSDLADNHSLIIHGVADLAHADSTQVAFVAQKKYLADVPATKAGVLLLSKGFADEAAVPADALALIVPDAYLAYASISVLFAPAVASGIHPSAVIDKDTDIAHDVTIGAGVVIKNGVSIGAGSYIGAGSFIGAGTVLGARCHIAPQVFIAHDCIIGDEVRIHSHASIGSEGFGFAPTKGATGIEWQRIAQLGRVVIGNQVRIGSNTCIDRGAVGDTVIGDHVIIDNLVQIAHNVQVGSGTAMAAKVAIAGSTSIGKNCIIGGATGISGHLSITDGVTITAMSMVISDIQQAGSYSSGTVAMPTHNWRRAALKFRKLGDK